ncbi:MAG: NAD(P)H-dependent oxidoreductase [Candidatus Eremiobacteraeota bacterium]|nr:NAD(P)H-dependent oxidoreductase [Candidatus Eremiobacteraeota bacterium]
MSKLLLVETSPRGEHSISRELARGFVQQWKSAHPEGQVVLRDLEQTDLPYLDMDWVTASVTPVERQTHETKRVLGFSDQLVAELLSADHLVISTPVYNYNVPARLKSYIDHIVRKGVTLGMRGEGLVLGKKATLLMASGGVYTEGSPIRDRDVATTYLRLILKVLGFEDVSVVAAGGAKVVDLGEKSRAEFLEPLAAAVVAAAGWEGRDLCRRRGCLRRGAI